MNTIFEMINSRIEDGDMKMILIKGLFGTLAPTISSKVHNLQAEQELYAKVYETFDYEYLKSKSPELIPNHPFISSPFLTCT